MNAVDTAIIVSIITCLGTLIGVIINSRTQTKEFLSELKRQSELTDAKLDAKIETIQELTSMRIDELTREVRENNNLAKRVPVLEARLQAIEKKIGI